MDPRPSSAQEPSSSRGALFGRSLLRHKRGTSTPDQTSPVSPLFASRHRNGQSIDVQPFPPPPAYRVRFSPHMDTRRALAFAPIVRTVRVDEPPVQLGRVEGPPPPTKTGKVGFNTKVVSRAHAEIWVGTDGTVWVRDTKSASGTFLNHVRLSAANEESRPFPVRDGDVLQLGVDYQGGMEDAYKSVKIKVEMGLDGGDIFGAGALQGLQTLASPDAPPAAGKPIIPDCCICLSSISIRQALFTTPCAHTFHFKCIRPIIDSKKPPFICPLCRTHADLDEEVDGYEIVAPPAPERERALPSLPNSPNSVTEIVPEVDEESFRLAQAPPTPPSRSPPLQATAAVDGRSRVATTRATFSSTSRPSLPHNPRANIRRKTSLQALERGRSPSLSRLQTNTELPPVTLPETSPLGEGWRREMELMAGDSQFSISLDPQRGQERGRPLGAAPPTPPTPGPMPDRAPLLERERVQLSDTGPIHPAQTTAAVPIAHLHRAQSRSGNRNPPPASRPFPPPATIFPPQAAPQATSVGERWRREMELMEQDKEYVVSMETQSMTGGESSRIQRRRPSSDSERRPKPEATGAGLKRSGTWNRFMKH